MSIDDVNGHFRVLLVFPDDTAKNRNEVLLFDPIGQILFHQRWDRNGDEDGDELLGRVGADSFASDNGESANVGRRPSCTQLLKLDGFEDVHFFESANYGVKAVDVLRCEDDGVGDIGRSKISACDLEFVDIKMKEDGVEKAEVRHQEVVQSDDR